MRPAPAEVKGTALRAASVRDRKPPRCALAVGSGDRQIQTMWKHSRAVRRDRLVRTLALCCLGGLLWIGERGEGTRPPLGPLLDPLRGVWALARSADLPPNAQGRVAGLGHDVTVLYDERAVPHIFAGASWTPTARSATRPRATGCSSSTSRPVPAAARSLSCSAPRALELDREVRGLGMSRAAERLMTSLPDTGELRSSLNAYAAGVNAYLDALPPGDLPLEYRLLNAHPVRWSALRSIQVLLRMGYTLTQNETELDHASAAALVGREAADALFPLHSPIQEPVQPAEGEPRRLPLDVPSPGLPDQSGLAQARPLAPRPRERTDGDDLGSNNWAVSPSAPRPAALLAGDPHLDLTLPSIWYEAHLVVPGALDVYGVTIPGLPPVRDRLQPRRRVDVHEHGRRRDGRVRRAGGRHGASDALSRRRRVATARAARRGVSRPRGETIAADTMLLHASRTAPAVRGRWISLRWTVLEARTRRRGLHRRLRSANGARSVEDAMAASYQAPAQNMLAADRAGTSPSARRGAIPSAPATAAAACSSMDVERERLEGRLGRRGVAAGIRSGAGLSRVGQPAAASIRATALVFGGELGSVARAAHQHAAPRRRLGHARRRCVTSRPIREARAPTSSCRTSCGAAASRARAGPSPACSRGARAARSGGTVGTRGRRRAPCCSRRRCARRPGDVGRAARGCAAGRRRHDRPARRPRQPRGGRSEHWRHRAPG